MMASTSHSCPPPLRYGHAHVEAGCQARNEAELGRWLQNYDVERWRRGLAPHFRQAFDSALASCRPKSRSEKSAALLLSGGLRTGTSPSGLKELANSLKALRKHASSVEAFAYLNPEADDYRHKQQTPECYREQLKVAARRLSDGANPLPCAAKPDHRNMSLRIEAFSAVFAAEGTPLEIELHNDTHPLLPNASAAGCPADHAKPPNADQFLKVDAATAMMRRAELRRGAPFGFVVRLRPDLCGGAAFAGLAARTLKCTSPLPLIAHDLAGAYPRFLADAYTSLWRIGCAVPGGWSTAGACNGRLRGGELVPTAALMRWAAGAPSLDVSGGGFNISGHPGVFMIGLRRVEDRCEHKDVRRKCILPPGFETATSVEASKPAAVAKAVPKRAASAVASAAARVAAARAARARVAAGRLRAGSHERGGHKRRV